MAMDGTCVICRDRPPDDSGLCGPCADALSAAIAVAPEIDEHVKTLFVEKLRARHPDNPLVGYYDGALARAIMRNKTAGDSDRAAP